jgi:hypothetical protein
MCSVKEVNDRLVYVGGNYATILRFSLKFEVLFFSAKKLGFDDHQNILRL